MQSYEVTLPEPTTGDYVDIGVLCCQHFGNKGCDRDKAYGWRNWLLETPDRYCANLGDDMENAVPGDEKHNSMMWDQDMTPDEQYMEACEFWKPLAERGKLLITHDSNHHWRSEAKTGISRARDINVFLQGTRPGEVSPLPVPSVNKLPYWGRWQSTWTVMVGGHSYVIHSWHGVGNGCTPEAALRRCRSMAVQNPRCDIFLMGHAHNKITWQDQYNVPGKHGQRTIERERTFGVTGGFLGWHDTYAERMGLPPNKRGAILLRLCAKRWDVKISL